MHASPAQRKPSGASLAFLALAGVLGAGPVAAHEFLAEFVQHRLDLRVGARHIDLTVELTFFEKVSAHERERMDANADGRIAREEVAAYLDRVAPGLQAGLQLHVDAQRLDLIPLYPPELEFLGQSDATPAQHRLRLSYFAPTPARLKAGSELVLEDGLWPGARALSKLDFEATDGCVLRPRSPTPPHPSSPPAASSIVFRMRCEKPPTIPQPPGKEP